MPTLPLRFPGAPGDALGARLELPEQPPRAFALFAHCFTLSDQLFNPRQIVASLSTTSATLALATSVIGLLFGLVVATGLTRHLRHHSSAVISWDSWE